jgi:hypothetical protein
LAVFCQQLASKGPGSTPVTARTQRWILPGIASGIASILVDASGQSSIVIAGGANEDRFDQS